MKIYEIKLEENYLITEIMNNEYSLLLINIEIIYQDFIQA